VRENTDEQRFIKRFSETETVSKINPTISQNKVKRHRIDTTKTH